MEKIKLYETLLVQKLRQHQKSQVDLDTLQNKLKKNQNGNRRDELLRVCARPFREKGLDGATIRDISSAAGMHSGSPFYHFPNKQEMLDELAREKLVAGDPRLARLLLK